ncbi:cytochrome P450 [Jimgerdemannia flammicorona]|uniref:Cytochrome P450 n=1 Tax=Jimgerdemannia flammicorona TaxID=994334 RepID=A0A433QVV3_9FUNG|nr:cytochrome P450 [Jimgerdemannia flammicorona]
MTAPQFMTTLASSKRNFTMHSSSDLTSTGIFSGLWSMMHAKYIILAIGLFYAYKIYKSIVVPPNLKHIPAIPFWATLQSFFSGESAAQRNRRLIIPKLEGNDGIARGQFVKVIKNQTKYSSLNRTFHRAMPIKLFSSLASRMFEVFEKEGNFVEVNSVFLGRDKRLSDRTLRIVHVSLFFNRFTLDVIGKAAFNFNFDDNIAIFFIAGHDTTSIALSCAMYYLAVNQDMQKKARDEVLRILGDELHPVAPTLEQTKDLKYVNAVMKETMRCNPPTASVMTRVATEDIQLGSHFVPKGSHVVLDIFAIHHSPQAWEDSERFDPDRFAEGGEYESKAPGSCTWMPFGSQIFKLVAPYGFDSQRRAKAQLTQPRSPLSL